MKRWVVLAVLGLGMLFAASAFADDAAAPGKMAKPAKMPKTMMSMYLVESPHTEAECLGVMDDAKKMKTLDEWSWGCESGNHTGYMMIKAKDEQDALAKVPESVRGKAHAYKVGKMTAAQLEALHKQHNM